LHCFTRWATSHYFLITSSSAMDKHAHYISFKLIKEFKDFSLTLKLGIK